MINKKSQSLVELATFGTVLLLCLAMLIRYGMQANYQQSLHMRAFRRAMLEAFSNSGPNAGVTLSMTEDKGIPDPRDLWGFPDRAPMSSSGSVTWDSNLQAIYIDDYGDPTDDTDLPSMAFDINEDRAEYMIADFQSRDCSGEIYVILEGERLVNEPPGCTWITITIPCEEMYGDESCEGMITIRRLVDGDGNECEGWTAGGSEYIAVPRRCDQIRVYRDEGGGKAYPYVRIDLLKRRIGSADIDDDGEIEYIIAVRGNTPACPDDFCGEVRSFRYVDYQEGEIDTEFTVINPWEGSPGDRQGLLSDYTLVKDYRNTLENTETPTRFRTTTSYGSTQQQMTHKIRLRSRDIDEYISTFRKPDNFTWTVDK